MSAGGWGRRRGAREARVDARPDAPTPPNGMLSTVGDSRRSARGSNGKRVGARRLTEGRLSAVVDDNAARQSVLVDWKAGRRQASAQGTLVVEDGRKDSRTRHAPYSIVFLLSVKSQMPSGFSPWLTNRTASLTVCDDQQRVRVRLSPPNEAARQGGKRSAPPWAQRQRSGQTPRRA